jgi:hypothetical protein
VREYNGLFWGEGMNSNVRGSKLMVIPSYSTLSGKKKKDALKSSG